MKIDMADQGNRKEVYYFACGFRYKVLQEYISSTRKHEIFRETRPKNAMDIKSWEVWLTASLNVASIVNNHSEQSCYTLKVLGKRTSRKSWWCCSRTASILLLYSIIHIIIPVKRNNYDMEADNFLRTVWVSAVSEHLGLWTGERR